MNDDLLLASPAWPWLWVYRRKKGETSTHLLLAAHDTFKKDVDSHKHNLSNLVSCFFWFVLFTKAGCDSFHEECKIEARQPDGS